MAWFENIPGPNLPTETETKTARPDPGTSPQDLQHWPVQDWQTSDPAPVADENVPGGHFLGNFDSDSQKAPGGQGMGVFRSQ